MTKSRGTWGDIKPVTKVVQDKTKYNRKKDKQKLRKGDY